MASEQHTAVYVIGWSDAGPLKIGLSQNPKKRLNEIQTGCPYPLRLIGVRNIKSRRLAFAVEGLMHLKLSKHRLSGEWFDVTSQRARAAMESMLGKHHDFTSQTKEKQDLIVANLVQKAAIKWKSGSRKDKNIYNKAMKAYHGSDEMLNIKRADQPLCIQ